MQHTYRVLLTRGLLGCYVYFEDDATRAFLNNAYDTQNLQYAVRLHRALLQVNGNVDRGVRRARFLTVLRGQNRPAVLLEGGYLSNPREARLIADPAYRQKLAEAVAKALTEEPLQARSQKSEDRTALKNPPPSGAEVLTNEITNE